MRRNEKNKKTQEETTHNKNQEDTKNEKHET